MKSLKPNRAGRIWLLVLLAILALLWSCGGSGGSPPSQLSRFPDDLNDPNVKATGIYPDGWTGETGSVVLQQPGGEQVLTIRGMVPGVGNADFHTAIELRVDNNSVGRQSVGLGDFRISAAVPPGAGKRHVVVTFSSLQQLAGGDGRKVGARLQFIGFEPAKRAAATVSSDIVRGSGMQLGTGWGVIETFRNETFRWVENDAQIRIIMVQAETAVLSVIVEPGPGVGGRAFLLKVLDGSGRQVDAAPVARRGVVKLFVPIQAGQPNEFRLHVDGGGKPTPHDPRILNFRIFEVRAEPWNGDGHGDAK